MYKIYVAGASREVETSVKYIKKLKKAGFEITHDWTRDVVKYKKQNKTDKDLSLSDKIRFASIDIDAVITANILWVILPKKHIGIGYWVELGAGLASYKTYKKWIIISGDYHRSIFCAKAHFTKSNHDDAYDLIVYNLPAFKC